MTLNNFEILFVVWVFLFQIVLIAHFAVRKRAYHTYTMKYGWIVYLLGVPALVVSLVMILGDQPWSFWVGGFIQAVFSIYGYRVDYRLQIPWRKPISWPVFWPYVSLYLGTIMFYWWPLGLIKRELWYAYAVLFVVSTILNVTSH